MGILQGVFLITHDLLGHIIDHNRSKIQHLPSIPKTHILVQPLATVLSFQFLTFRSSRPIDEYDTRSTGKRLCLLNHPEGVSKLVKNDAPLHLVRHAPQYRFMVA